MKKRFLLYVIIFCTHHAIEAKSIYPGEVVGRSLHIPSLGWLGHVGITFAESDDAQPMMQSAHHVIEVLNQPEVIQINTLKQFKSTSEYWGSRYGIATNDERGYHVLTEANQQQWWCPVYTFDTDYQIGHGDTNMGDPIQCGRWRCDTFVWWSFYSQGWDTMSGRFWLPSILFHAFPYANDDHPHTTPFYKTQPIRPLQYDMQSAWDDHLNKTDRIIAIDHLTTQGTTPHLAAELIQLYRTTPVSAIRTHIIAGLMLYYQHHFETLQHTDEYALLKQFFAELLHEQHSAKITDYVIRGFIDLHTPDEIFNHLALINQRLSTVHPTSSIMLKYALVHKSKRFHTLYIPAIIQELREAHDVALNNYFFGPLSVAYQHQEKNKLEPEAEQMVIAYLDEIAQQYTLKNTQKPVTLYYFKLRNQLKH